MFTSLFSNEVTIRLHQGMLHCIINNQKWIFYMKICSVKDYYISIPRFLNQIWPVKFRISAPRVKVHDNHQISPTCWGGNHGTIQIWFGYHIRFCMIHVVYYWFRLVMLTTLLQHSLPVKILPMESIWGNLRCFNIYTTCPGENKRYYVFFYNLQWPDYCFLKMVYDGLLIIRLVCLCLLWATTPYF